MRYALVILDGLSDRPGLPEGQPTPLASARRTHLDRLAADGQTGRVRIIEEGVAPESDAGVLALLGYDPVADSPGRGVLEALGAELPLAPEDVAFRLNFATADGEGTILDARVGRNLATAEASELARALSGAELLRDRHVRAEVRATVGHRGVLWLHPEDGTRLSSQVSNSDPFYDRVGGRGQARRVDRPVSREVVPLDATPEARRTAEVVNAFLARAGPVLAGHGVNARRAMGGRKIANTVLLRNAGALPARPPEPFASRHGRAATAVTEMPVERGIARLFGLADRFVGPMGADRDRALEERARVTREALASSPFVYVHLKGPDEPGHDGDAERKRDVIEALDRAFFGPFLAGLDPADIRIAVTADHATPAALRGHSDDPVPLLLWGAGVPAQGGAARFDELHCAAPGGLGLRRAGQVLELLFASGFDPPRA